MVAKSRTTNNHRIVTKDVLNNPASLNKFQQAQGELSGALSRLMVVVEKYPDLKANQNFLDLQKQLEGTENRINVARERYNRSVQVFNTSIRTFPNSATNSLVLHLCNAKRHSRRKRVPRWLLKSSSDRVLSDAMNLILINRMCGYFL